MVVFRRHDWISYGTQAPSLDLRRAGFEPVVSRNRKAFHNKTTPAAASPDAIPNARSGFTWSTSHRA